MPLTRNGVTFTTAYLEAAAIAAADRAMLDTLELYHPALPQRLRFVNDHVPLFATLEVDAPADGGVEVEFLACLFRLKPAEESDNASNPDITIEVSNISGAVSDALRLARGSIEPWTVTGRIYASDSLAAPAMTPPTVVELRAVQLSSTTALLTCNFGDAGNVGVPALTFKRSEYPTLAR